MFQLTIDVGHTISVTTHPDHAAAHRHLVRHVVIADYYLHTAASETARSSYELLAFAEDRRRPHRAGRATIDDLAAGPAVRRATSPGQSRPVPT